MGEISDYFIENTINRHLKGPNKPHYDDLTLFHQWETSTGKKIKLTEMTDNHLINCHKRITRRRWRIGWLPNIEKELRTRNIKIPKYDPYFYCDASEVDLY